MGKASRAKVVNRRGRLPNGCIYCRRNREKITVEHIIATRFIDVLARDPRGLRTPLSMTWTDPRSGEIRRSVGKLSKRGKPTLEFTAKVCHSCNNEWMNQIDDAAWPYVEPMIRGHATSLDVAAQMAIATWIAKIAITARFSTVAPAPVEEPWTQDLFTSRQISAGWYAFVGAYSGTRGLWYLPDDIRLEEAEGELPNARLKPEGRLLFEHGVLATLALGYLVLQVLGFTDPIEIPAFHDPTPMIQIWPPEHAAIAWPPTQMLDDDGLLAVAGKPSGTRFLNIS